MNTQLQNNRQASIGQDNLTAAQGQDLLPNQGSTVPSVLQMQSLMEQARAAQSSLPNIQPPSEEEISHNMWMASGIMGLVAALVSGNAAGGIAAGMTAALAVHDRGYDLRQRGEYVMELHNKGYSAPAILSWYETGDNKELDKERDEMDKLANDEITREEREADRKQQLEMHNDTIANQWNIANMHERGANARAIAAGGKADIVAKHQEERENYEDIKDGLGSGNKVNRDNWEKARQAYAKFESALQMSDIPVAQEQLLMMAQIIDANNLSPQLSKMHFFTTAAQHGPMDWVKQVALKVSHDGTLTPEEMADIKTVFEAAEGAAEKQYESSVRDTLSAYDLSEPASLRHAVSYSGLPISVVKTMGSKPLAQQFGEGVAVGSKGNPEVTYKDPDNG